MKVILLLIVLALPCLAQVADSPPINPAIFDKPGQVIRSFDEFTGKGRVEAFLPLQKDESGSLGLILSSTLATNTKPFAVLMLVAMSAKASHKDDALYLLVDGERYTLKPLYTELHTANGQACELLSFPAGYFADEMAALGEAKSLRGRIGGYWEFEIDAAARKTIAEFAKQMDKQK